MMPTQWLTRYRFFAATLMMAVALGGACNCDDDPDPDRDVGVNDVEEDVVDDVEDDVEDDVIDPVPDIPEGISRVQIIHDSADPAAATVDLYANDTLLVDDFAYRTATSYVDIDAGTYDFTIAPAGSDSVDDGIITFEDVEFDEQRRYIVVASGVIDPDDFADNPDDRDIGLTLHVVANTREEAEDDNFNQLMLFHGVTDAPEVDLFAENAATLVSELGYGDFTDGYLSLPPGITVFDLLVTATQDRINSYQTPPLGTGDAFIGLASGFLDADQNEDAPFDILVYPSTTEGDRLDPIILQEAARLQLVHNSLDPAAEEVDIFVDGELLADEVAFRDASPFLTFPAGVDLEFSVTAAGAGDPDDFVLRETFEFAFGSSQLAVVSGVLDPADFPDNPDGISTELDIYPLADARERGISDDDVDVAAFHGILDLPAVDATVEANGTDVDFADDLSYGEFTDYGSLPTVDSAVVSLAPASDPDPLASFTFDLSGFGAQSILLIASGLADDGDIAAVVVFPDGTTAVVGPDDD